MNYAQFVQQFCLLSHFKGKSHLENALLRHAHLPGQIVRTKAGFTMQLDDSSPFERQAYFYNCERDTHWFIERHLKAGQSFVDCGANLGYFSLLAATLGAQTFAFEPFAGTYKRLAANADRNELTIDARPIALSDHIGTAPIYEMARSPHGMYSLYDTQHSGAVVGTCEVDTVDNQLTEIVPDMVKIDVEGSERDLLRGASSWFDTERPPTFIMELSRYSMRPNGYEPEDIADIFWKDGRFEMFWPRDYKMIPVKQGEPLPHYATIGLDWAAGNYVFRPRHLGSI